MCRKFYEIIWTKKHYCSKMLLLVDAVYYCVECSNILCYPLFVWKLAMNQIWSNSRQHNIQHSYRIDDTFFFFSFLILFYCSCCCCNFSIVFDVLVDCCMAKYYLILMSCVDICICVSVRICIIEVKKKKKIINYFGTFTCCYVYCDAIYYSPWWWWWMYIWNWQFFNEFEWMLCVEAQTHKFPLY